ncbi:unnamed protein product [Enterobius vermicularis]|uniref:Uncharacterized protein n=1 Tax=Enterobius vermicularis TaxID=51028 RepID=A0A0N4V3W9_ENTVE|nr:unnamed protein product [Enterobius vermicularis]
MLMTSANQCFIDATSRLLKRWFANTSAELFRLRGLFSVPLGERPVPLVLSTLNVLLHGRKNNAVGGAGDDGSDGIDSGDGDAIVAVAD